MVRIQHAAILLAISDRNPLIDGFAGFGVEYPHFAAIVDDIQLVVNQ